MTTQNSAATVVDVGVLDELLKLQPPENWMIKISPARLEIFLKYVVKSPRSVVLLTRWPGAALPIGYVFAVLDPKWFWIVFALQNPIVALSIFLYRLMGSLERRRKERRKSISAGPSDVRAGFPEFSWSPSHSGIARVLALYVRKEHRNKGVAMNLYSELFEVLRKKGGLRVEEYRGADFSRHAGKFAAVSGCRVQQCRTGGYKISKDLRDSAALEIPRA